MSQSAQSDEFDLKQFYQVFFEEAGDNLDTFEQLLLAIDIAAPSDETLHAIFRCAHSVKGGAATFGFADVAALTHAMETLLDGLRRHEQAPTTAMIDTLLQAGDILRALLRVHQTGGGDSPDTQDLLRDLNAHAKGGAAVAASAPAVPAAAPSQTNASADGTRDLEMMIGPKANASMADDLTELFGEVSGGGSLELANTGSEAEGFLRFHLRTTASDTEVLDLCSFHVERDQIMLSPWMAQEAVAVVPVAVVAPVATSAVAAPSAPTHRASATSETLRVAVDKVDQLINLMGELVITQAMLTQRAARLDSDARAQLMGGLGDLERTTRDLQESVMSIRMIPMSDVFNRFPRMLRDLASRLGKQLELRTVGEATELDKGLIEKITDPLTHLVRNSVDHGIELPAERIAAGKPAHGTLTLTARHEGGCIAIEVADDGKGLDREKLLAKARKSGMPVSDAMSDADVYALIFAPGFSTADAVTDISGRGVGMDVVRRNILSLGGSVELDSTFGKGTCVRVRLPLTLAIMDGMSVSVAGELYLLPLSSVIESFQAPRGAMRTMANDARVVKVREDYLPVVSLAEVMSAESAETNDEPMLVVIQAEGRRVALEIGALVGQQQVVVKNLESNFRKVRGVSGATIMGDGSVALILDVAMLVRGNASRPSGHTPDSSDSSFADASRNSGKEVPAAVAQASPAFEIF